MSAQSCDSVPPAPAWTVAMASLASYVPDRSDSSSSAPMSRFELTRRRRRAPQARSGSSSAREELVDRDGVVELALQIVEPLELGVQAGELGGERWPRAGRPTAAGRPPAAGARQPARGSRRRQRNPLAASSRPASALADPCTRSSARVYRRASGGGGTLRRRPRRTVCWPTIWGRPCSRVAARRRARPAFPRRDRQGAGVLAAFEAPGATERGDLSEAISQMGGTVAKTRETAVLWPFSRTRPPRRRLAHARRLDRQRGLRRGGVGVLPSRGAGRRDAGRAPRPVGAGRVRRAVDQLRD